MCLRPGVPVPGLGSPVGSTHLLGPVRKHRQKVLPLESTGVTPLGSSVTPPQTGDLRLRNPVGYVTKSWTTRGLFLSQDLRTGGRIEPQIPTTVGEGVSGQPKGKRTPDTTLDGRTLLSTPQTRS